MRLHTECIPRTNCKVRSGVARFQTDKSIVHKDVTNERM